MADLMNKAFATNRLTALHSTSQYISYHELPIILSPETPFAKADELLFEIPTLKDRFVDLYVDHFIAICLDKIVNGIHEATTCFNIIINMFDIFFTSRIESLLKKLKRKVALSLWKLQGEGTPSETKKILGWMIDTRLLSMALPITKGAKWKGVIAIMIESEQSPAKELEKLIGKLVRVSIIIPGSNTFIKPLRRAFY